MAKDKYLKNVVTLELDVEKCNGCRMCTRVCPHAVFEMREKRAFIVGRDACMECGACALNCEQGALTVQKGVGCAAAVIGSAIGAKSGGCC